MSRAETGRRAWLAGALLALAAAALPAQGPGLLARLPPDLREQLLQRQARWADWSEEERAAFARRAEAWDRLAPQAQAEARERYAAWQALDSIDREQVQAARARFAALPPAEQAQLRADYAGLDEHVRRGWLLGPRLGADYPALQPLLAQVPAEQRAPLLRVLRSMTPAQRADLAVLMQRTPAEERDALRRALLSTSDDNRGAWLRLRLER
jgi:hypothetical protein